MTKPTPPYAQRNSYGTVARAPFDVHAVPPSLQSYGAALGRSGGIVASLLKMRRNKAARSV